MNDQITQMEGSRVCDYRPVWLHFLKAVFYSEKQGEEEKWGKYVVS